MRVDRLKQMRERSGLTQRELADMVGIHHQQYYRIETGQSDTTGDTLTRIAQALEVSVDYLVGLVDEPNAIFSDDTLTPMERRLIWALRKGFITEALESFTAITKADDQTVITPDEPAVKG